MKIVLLGSGNVATHLGLALKAAGEEIIQVWSRSMENASALAVKLGAEATCALSEVSPDADIYIIAVNDDAIADVAARLPDKNKLVVHTSGSTGIDVLMQASAQIGVLYPLQTFSKIKPVDFSEIPIAVEGNSAEVVATLKSLAEKLSHKTLEMSSAQRLILHVAAVFACNFTNHLYNIASGVLKQRGLDFELIRPLIAETAGKIQTNEPHKVQTGPAVRNDLATMSRHMEALKEQPQLAEMYRMLSESIVNLHKQDKA